MRKITVALAILFALLAGFAGWFTIGGTLRARTYIQTASAADYPEAFGAIRELVEAGSAPQRFGSDALTKEPSAYTLADINVTLANRGLFPAEWLDIRVEPVPGDIAVYALTGEGGNIAARDTGTVNLKLITTAPADSVREITIQYYVHGMKRTITVR